MTIGEIARILDTTTATIRNRIKKFGPYLSPSARKRTGKRFTRQDLETLRTIQGYIEGGLSLDEIPEHLTLTPEIVHGQDEIPTFEDWQPTNESAISLPQVMDFVQQALDNQADQHQREIDALNRLIEKLETDLETARKPFWQFWK